MPTNFSVRKQISDCLGGNGRLQGVVSGCYYSGSQGNLSGHDISTTLIDGVVMVLQTSASTKI